VPYRIDNHLVRGLDYYCKTVFEIVEETPANEDDTEEAPAPLSLAGGGRYDYLAKHIGGKKDVPSMGVSIGVDRVVQSASHKVLTPRILKKPKVYFIQLGFDAKLKSLEVIEILRTAKIPVQQSLAKDKLSGQLGVAEKLRIPYTIILGQREAIDGTVIVRNMKNRSQDTVKITDLAEYLKKNVK
jgi:histidyl-tRNA synthetase